MELIHNNNIETKIYHIRGYQVMLDNDLAILYQVETKYLKRMVKRNIERFNEEDFMFQLTKNEFENLRCQIGTSSWGGTRYLPFAFTEQGVYMLSSVLKSDISINVSKQIMRTFTKLKNQSVPYFDIIKRLESLESDNKETKDLLHKVVSVVSNMQELQNEANEKTKKIGFINDGDTK